MGEVAAEVAGPLAERLHRVIPGEALDTDVTAETEGHLRLRRVVAEVVQEQLAGMVLPSALELEGMAFRSHFPRRSSTVRVAAVPQTLLVQALPEEQIMAVMVWEECLA